MPETIYFDYCATTPVDPKVLDAMLPCMQGVYGNPSSLHAKGREAEGLLTQARSQVAEALGAQPHEIVFTSGATEANNLALQGTLRAAGEKKKHLITSAVEHHAVLHTAEALVGQGCELTILPVDSAGCIDPEDVRKAIRSNTGLISIMYVNNETGAVQPILEVAQLAAQYGIPFHTDAVQATGFFSIDVSQYEIDLLSLSGHKIYGPKGVGALFVREGIQLSALTFGGPQEARLRAGTENVPGIVGLGAAMDLIREKREAETARLSELRQIFISALQSNIPTAIINGDADRTAPHVLSVSFPGADAEMMLFRLDQEGFAASMGSACNAESIEPSHVLQALGLPEEHIQGTLRFSLGYPSDAVGIERLMAALPKIVKECMTS